MKEKYGKITITILLCIPVIVSLFFIDKWILPQKKFNDEIIAYSTISYKNSNRRNNYSQSKIYLGTKFFTRKGNEFSLEKGFVEENKVTIERSYFFRSITSVKSPIKDYSNKLTSGLNGGCWYFIIGVTISSIISLLILRFNRNLSENGFQNIFLINSFLTIIALYLFVIYN
ncbi:MAG: hypothetical protein ABIQ27_00700 [Flavobacterium sp.]|uniref:hypothetical protein n=1 Tax=Flavobacterium sp. TaxID=239 RepID=UPI00326771FD